MGDLLHSLGLAGYRSFGPDLQTTRLQGRVHLVAGPNNAGKSNVLRAAELALSSMKVRQSLPLSLEDVPQGKWDLDFTVAVGIGDIDKKLDELFLQQEPAVRETLRQFQDSDAAPWLDHQRLEIRFTHAYGADEQGAGWQLAITGAVELSHAVAGFSYTNPLENLSRQLAAYAGQPEENLRRVVEELMNRLDFYNRLPPVETISAFRQIRADGEGPQADGFGLIQRLGALQSPAYGSESDRDRFDRVNAFLQVLFEDKHARLEVPHDSERLLVRFEHNRLPLENLGTGFHQAVILAATATVLSGHLICIEEPEMHLHPTLQRRLVRYLAESTDNQYLIATHSAAMLDTARASVSAVRLESGQSKISPVVTPDEIAAVSFDLGHRASDLVQANAVIWVEGPSDRTYIGRCLSVLAPDLVEGVHYSIMFYGGSMLSHLAADDPTVSEFIALPRLNRNFAVVIDSDKGKPSDRINPTKRRVRDEIRAAGTNTLVWITKGYTIENYVPPNVLSGAVTEAHPGARTTWAGALYANPFLKTRVRGRTSPVEKARVAQHAVQAWDVNEWPHDLKQRTNDLIRLIRKANS